MNADGGGNHVMERLVEITVDIEPWPRLYRRRHPSICYAGGNVKRGCPDDDLS